MTAKERRVSLGGGVKNTVKLAVLMTAQLCEYTKNY